jgi:hypothetical protein
MLTPKAALLDLHTDAAALALPDCTSVFTLNMPLAALHLEVGKSAHCASRAFAPTCHC